MTGTDDQANSPAGTTPDSVRRASIGSAVVVQLILALVLLISVNYLSGAYHRAWDLSRSKEFSLSPQTRNLLKSALVRGRDKPVMLLMVVQTTSPHRDRLRAMAEEYERVSGKAVVAEFVDPVRNGDRALELSHEYETEFVEDLVIIDAVPELPAQEGGEDGEDAGESARKRAERLGELRRSHVQFVPVEDMLVYGTGIRSERRVVGYQDENQLTSGILRAIEGKARRFYFLADKSQVSGTGEDAPWEFLRRTFASINVELEPIRLSGSERIPEDAAGVALVAPRYDLDEKELAVFREYWLRPRAAVIMVLDPTLRQQPPNLRAFLRDHGVTPRANRIFTLRDGRRSYAVAASFTNSAAAGDLGNAATMFEGASASLEVRENAEDLALRRIEPYPLIETLDGSWAEPLDGSGEPVPGPHCIGASISRGNERSDAFAEETSRMVVLSNTSFLQPAERHKEHIDFLHNSTHWLIGREELIGIGPKPVQLYVLGLADAQATFANRLNLFIIPGVFLLIAAAVWNARRA